MEDNEDSKFAKVYIPSLQKNCVVPLSDLTDYEEKKENYDDKTLFTICFEGKMKKCTIDEISEHDEALRKSPEKRKRRPKFNDSDLQIEEKKTVKLKASNVGKLILTKSTNSKSSKVDKDPPPAKKAKIERERNIVNEYLQSRRMSTQTLDSREYEKLDEEERPNTENNSPEIFKEIGFAPELEAKGASGDAAGQRTKKGAEKLRNSGDGTKTDKSDEIVKSNYATFKPSRQSTALSRGYNDDEKLLKEVAKWKNNAQEWQNKVEVFETGQREWKIKADFWKEKAKNYKELSEEWRDIRRSQRFRKLSSDRKNWSHNLTSTPEVSKFGLYLYQKCAY